MPIRLVARKLERFFIYRVFHVDDTPHRIALGLAIGIFVTWTPTMGLQMALTVLLAALLRANKFVGVPFVWISNPVTAVPLYGFNYLVGTWILPGGDSMKQFTDAVTRAAFTGGGWTDKIAAWWTETWPFIGRLWVGSLAVALVLSVTTYIVIRWSVVRYRKIWHKRHPAAPPMPLDDGKGEVRAAVEETPPPTTDNDSPTDRDEQTAAPVKRPQVPSCGVCVDENPSPSQSVAGGPHVEGNVTFEDGVHR